MFYKYLCIWIEYPDLKFQCWSFALIWRPDSMGTFFLADPHWYFSYQWEDWREVEVVIFLDFLDFLVLVLVVYLTYFMYIYCKWICVIRIYIYRYIYIIYMYSISVFMQQTNHLLCFCHNIWKKKSIPGSVAWKFLHQTFCVFLSNSRSLGTSTGDGLIEIHELHELLNTSPKFVSQRVFAQEKWMVWSLKTILSYWVSQIFRG